MKFTKTPQQLNLESLSYQYIIDTCSILSQNDGFLYPRRVHVGLWREIDKLASESRLVVCSQIEKEVKRGARDDLAKEWLNSSGVRIIVESPGVQQMPQTDSQCSAKTVKVWRYARVFFRGCLPDCYRNVLQSGYHYRGKEN